MWGGKNGLALSLLSSHSPPSLPHVFSCSSCRTPHLFSQGHAGGSLRDHCCATGQPGPPQPARQHPRTQTGDPSEKPETLREYCSSSFSVHVDECQTAACKAFPRLQDVQKSGFLKGDVTLGHVYMSQSHRSLPAQLGSLQEPR